MALVEPLGFDSLWTIEHHFGPYGMAVNPLQLYSYMAGRTERIDFLDVDRASRDRLFGAIDRASHEGARLVRDGRSQVPERGFFVGPTINSASR